MTIHEMELWSRCVSDRTFDRVWSDARRLYLCEHREGYRFTQDMLDAAQRALFELGIIASGGLKAIRR